MNEKRGQLLKNQNLNKIKEEVYNRVKEKVIELSNKFRYKNINSNKNTHIQNDRKLNDIKSYVLRRSKQIEQNQKKSKNPLPFSNLSDLGKYIYPTFGNYPSPNYKSIYNKKGVIPPSKPIEKSTFNHNFIQTGKIPPFIPKNRTSNIPTKQNKRINPQQEDKFRKMFYNDLYGGSTGFTGQLQKMRNINFNFNK